MRPNEILFKRSEGALGVSVTFRIVPGSENLLDPESGAGLHEKLGSWLTAIVTDKSRRLSNLTNALRELPEDSLIQSLKPVSGFRLESEGIADDFLGVPVEDNGQIHPAPVTKLDLGHINAPILVDTFGLSLAFQGSAAGPQAHVFSDEQFLLFHDAIDSLFINRQAFPVFEIGPDAAVTPEGVLSLEIIDTLE